MKSVLMSCRTGDDGFTKDFFMTLDKLDSYNAGFENGQLSVSQKKGFISLIPKDKKIDAITCIYITGAQLLDCLIPGGGGLKEFLGGDLPLGPWNP